MFGWNSGVKLSGLPPDSDVLSLVPFKDSDNSIPGDPTPKKPYVVFLCYQPITTPYSQGPFDPIILSTVDDVLQSYEAANSIEDKDTDFGYMILDYFTWSDDKDMSIDNYPPYANLANPEIIIPGIVEYWPPKNYALAADEDVWIKIDKKVFPTHKSLNFNADSRDPVERPGDFRVYYMNFDDINSDENSFKENG